MTGMTGMTGMTYRPQTKVIEIICMWKIDEECLNMPNEIMASPKFSFDNQLKFRLQLFPQCVYQYMHYVVIGFVLCSESKPNIEGRLSVINRERRNDKIVKVTKTIKKKGDSLPFLIERDLVLNKNNGFLDNNTLTLSLEVKINEFSIQVTGSTLRRALENAFENEKYCDITFAAGGRQLKAHKHILAERSEVFAAMFECDMKERKLDLVEIEDVDHEVFKEMLRFLYTGNIHNLNELAAELLHAADKYAIFDLKARCEETLSANLSVETAAETLVLADLYNLMQLKERSIDFIKATINEISETEGWQKIIENNHSRLLSEMVLLFARKLH